jgi:uncharacterized membrane protein (DUF2068 family)
VPPRSHRQTVQLPPGVAVGRFVPKFHYELLICGFRGHLLAGLDEDAEIDPVWARDMHGLRWHRCLRCDSWLPMHELATLPKRTRRRGRRARRDEIRLPLRGRPLRDKVILRIIAVDRAVHFIVLGALAAAIFLLAANQHALRTEFLKVVNALNLLGTGPKPTRHGFVSLVGDVLNYKSSSLYLFGTGVAAYALIEGAEAVGLWIQARWAEYLTFIATGAFLPYEIWELIHGVTVFKAGAFVVNVVILVYLGFNKRLFGLRGGEAAIHASYAGDIGWPALERTAPPMHDADGRPLVATPTAATPRHGSAADAPTSVLPADAAAMIETTPDAATTTVLPMSGEGAGSGGSVAP